MICEYCNKTFTTKSSLHYHQKTAKYCLKLRGENSPELECQYCDQKFTRKFNLSSHYNNCKNKLLKDSQDNLYSKIDTYKKQISKLEENYKEQISRLEEENNQLKQRNHELALRAIEKPSQIYNNELTDQRTINNSNSNNKMIDNRVLNMVPMNLTQDTILKALEANFTENHLMKGQKGVADFFIENILVTPDNKFLMKCTDPSRKVFMYLDQDGKVQKDVNADKLTKMINGPVNKVTKKLYDTIHERYYDNQNFNEEADDDEWNTQDEDRLTFVTDKMVEITSLKSNNTEFVKGLIPPLTT